MLPLEDTACVDIQDSFYIILSVWVFISVQVQWNSTDHKISVFNLLYNFIPLFITIISELILTATKTLTNSSLVILSFLTGKKKMFAEVFCERCTFHSAIAEICTIFPVSFFFPSYKTNIPLTYCWESHLQKIIVSSLSWLTQFALWT